jgi:hypothetical protein
VVELEQQQAEEKKERLQANEQRRADLLAARNAALEARKKALAQRAAQRDAVTAEKAEHMRKLHEEVLAEVTEEWEEKERRITAAREAREAAQAAASLARQQASKKRIEEALARERAQAEEDRQRREAALREKVCEGSAWCGCGYGCECGVCVWGVRVGCGEWV